MNAAVPQQLMKPESGGGLLLLRRITPLTRRHTVYFCSGAYRGRRLDTNRVGKFQCFQYLAESVVVAIGSIGQHHAMRHTFCDQRADLSERNLRLGLEANLFGYACLLAPLWIAGPDLGKIEPIARGNTGLFGGKRYADGHPAVL